MTPPSILDVNRFQEMYVLPRSSKPNFQNIPYSKPQQGVTLVKLHIDSRTQGPNDWLYGFEAGSHRWLALGRNTVDKFDINLQTVAEHVTNFAKYWKVTLWHAGTTIRCMHASAHNNHAHDLLLTEASWRFTLHKGTRKHSTYKWRGYEFRDFVVKGLEATVLAGLILKAQGKGE